MPFISDTAKRSVLQTATPDINIPQAGFSETFAASVGLTIDENLSISQSLNREGWQNRQELIRKKIDEDSLNRDDYMDRRGRFDYNRAATDLNDPSIKTDQVLEQERREMLAVRRKYADDVLERGNGMAQFLGMANAYMLDPISIATMPIALPATGAKSLSIAGRALLAARNAAVIETATELAIQPFVYEHKQDIESPYTYKDALTNIAGAAIGASALGGVAGGVSGYLRKVRGEVEAKGVITPEVETALSNIKRMEDTLSVDRKIEFDEDTAWFHGSPEAKSIGEFKASEGGELGQGVYFTKDKGFAVDFSKPRGEVQNLSAAMERSGVIEARLPKLKEMTKKDFLAERNRFYDVEAKKPEYKGEWSATVARNAEIAQQEKYAKEGFHGIAINEEKQAVLFNPEDVKVVDGGKFASEAAVKNDIDYLEALEVERELVRRPQVTPAQYDVPERPKASAASTSQRESFILEKEGLADDFNADMQRFNELDDPRIIQDDEVVSAGEFMKSIDDELEGIDSVLTCAYG